jgi:hypothetical protein
MKNASKSLRNEAVANKKSIPNLFEQMISLQVAAVAKQSILFYFILFYINLY